MDPLIFAGYGVVGGIIISIDSQSYEDDVFSLISFPMNYPAFIVFLFLEFSLANPAGLSLVFHPLAPVFWLAGLWTLIGAMVYGFVRLFRMGP